MAFGDVMFLNNSAAGARDYERWLGLEDTPFNVIHNGFEFPQKAPPEAARAELQRKLSIPHNVHIIGSILRFSE